MRKAKSYTIICHSQRGSVYEVSGDLGYLKSYFGLDHSITLEAGDFWHSKTVRVSEPKTIKTLMSALSKKVDCQYACCYNRPYYELKEESVTEESTVEKTVSVKKCKPIQKTLSF